ncbi:hypothetical protein [Gephyromycinifex aptenodytis]|uniref:hypothetical protein n=1 Tax=Gephyromycinifex aptenodytis TaxID=2716227 RepID=UPI001446F902|nr:hypothetical protein [Gephyromycinifex aptenodytis]
MRWDRLLADVEAQGEQQARAEREAEVRERLRIEQSQVPLAERLAAQTEPVLLYLRGGRSCQGVVRELGDGWIALDGQFDTSAEQVRIVLATAAIAQVEGMRPGRGSLGLADRLGLGHPLRELAERGRSVVLHPVSGPSRGGRLGWVGKDFVELVELNPQGATHSPVGAVVTIPFSGILALTAQ